ncbi:MAG TPA: hypothetical protein VFC46_07760 [Humisphaera sp.]|nr:hypothetical protein [Humisphaera sp.]
MRLTEAIMGKRILTTEPALKTVRATAPSPRLVEPYDLAAAIGAEATGVSLENAPAPVTLFALRDELLKRLQSTP